MRLAYANAYFRRNETRGGNVHVGQFIANAVALGNQVWTWPGDNHPDAHRLPAIRLRRLLALRQMDAICVRIGWYPPSACRWAVAPGRQLVGSPIIVWEFNTVPEYGSVLGRSDGEIRRAIKDFRFYGRGCDLAICVSRDLAKYVGENLGIDRVLTVPNGSDPELFKPDAPPVKTIERNPDQLNVVWIGSAYLPWHDFDLIFEAARILWDRGHGERIVFHIIGEGLKAIPILPPNVKYHGAQEYATMPRWLAAMDVGLCIYQPGPADYSSPMKLFDYMASGIAVVGTPQPQLKEVFGELGQLDLITPHDDPRSLAGLLMRLALDGDRLITLGKAGRQLVLSSYSWRKTVQDTINEIQILLDGRQRTVAFEL